jgi:ATP-dependent Lhr-like helicase
LDDTTFAVLSVEIKQAAEKVTDLETQMTVKRFDQAIQLISERTNKTKCRFANYYTRKFATLISHQRLQKTFKDCEAIIIDEWHNYLEQKRCSNGISLITIKQLFKMQIWNFGYH